MIDNNNRKIKCNLCGYEGHQLLEHVSVEHGIQADEYLQKYPGEPTVSQEFHKLLNNFLKNAPKPKKPEPKFRIGKIEFEVHTEVPFSKCLPLPEHYMFPKYGKLNGDIFHAALALARNRSIYISGISGSGKDAFIHALSFYTRRPTELFQIAPNTDISHWLFSRSFTTEGTGWEEGSLLTCLRDGFTTPSGKVIPYLILISDLDRADKSQVEILRLILDSIQGRVKGPKGITYPILPGTQIVATANTTGGGDNRGQYISANPLDSSILSRFHAGFEFHWMDWRDEEEIVRIKFPILTEKYPSIFSEIGQVVTRLREAIRREELFCDFSHRSLCSWLQHAEDYIVTMNTIPKTLLKITQRAWIDRLPDEETKLQAQRLIDPDMEGGAF